MQWSTGVLKSVGAFSEQDAGELTATMRADSVARHLRHKDRCAALTAKVNAVINQSAVHQQPTRALPGVQRALVLGDRSSSPAPEQ